MNKFQVLLMLSLTEKTSDLWHQLFNLKSNGFCHNKSKEKPPYYKCFTLNNSYDSSLTAENSK